MKKRDKRLEDDEELKQAWQIVKESVRQLKHDNKRNEVFKTLKASNTNTIDWSPAQTVENSHPLDRIIHHNDENSIFQVQFFFFVFSFHFTFTMTDFQ